MATPAEPVAPTQPAAPAATAAPAEPAAPAATVAPAEPAAPAAPPALLGGPTANLAVAAFVLLMLFLGVLAWDGDTALPNLTQTIAGLVAALLGVVINPDHTVSRRSWNTLARCALLAATAAAVALLVYPKHVDAVPALTSAVAAFAGLYVNTSKLTHSSTS